MLLLLFCFICFMHDGICNSTISITLLHQEYQVARYSKVMHLFVAVVIATSSLALAHHSM